MNPVASVFPVVCCRVSDRMLKVLCSWFQDTSDNKARLGCNTGGICGLCNINNRRGRKKVFGKPLIYFFTALINRTVDRTRGIMIASSQAKTAYNLLIHLKTNGNLTAFLVNCLLSPPFICDLWIMEKMNITMHMVIFSRGPSTLRTKTGYNPASFK